MQELKAYFFTHPMWTNKLARTALFCILALLPLSVVNDIFNALWPLWVSLAGLTGVTALVLVCIALYRITSEQLATAEAYIREQTALYRHYHIDAVVEIVEQFTAILLTRKQAISIVQKIRDEFEMGPIASHNLEVCTEE